MWSYLEEKPVWRSSLPAEYPCGLCIAWAKALKTWLSTPGVLWMEQHAFHDGAGQMEESASEDECNESGGGNQQSGAVREGSS